MRIKLTRGTTPSEFHAVIDGVPYTVIDYRGSLKVVHIGVQIGVRCDRRRALSGSMFEAYKSFRHREVLSGFLNKAYGRYLAEKAKRAVTVSAATMRPMAELPRDTFVFVAFDHAVKATHISVAKVSSVMPLPDYDGWWPLPDLTSMPAEFEGWDV